MENSANPGLICFSQSVEYLVCACPQNTCCSVEYMAVNVSTWEVAPQLCNPGIWRLAVQMAGSVITKFHSSCSLLTRGEGCVVPHNNCCSVEYLACKCYNLGSCSTSVQSCGDRDLEICCPDSKIGQVPKLLLFSYPWGKM